MQQRFRRGALSIGQSRCDGCERTMEHGEIYLAVDEKPSDKFKEEIIFLDEINCDECGDQLKDGEQYLVILDGDAEKCFCQGCLKKKGGEAFARKNAGKIFKYEKTKERSNILHFCVECCEKRRVGMEKKEKGEKIFTFFSAKTAR